MHAIREGLRGRRAAVFAGAILAGILALLLAGCSAQQTPQEEESAPAQTDSTAQTQGAPEQEGSEQSAAGSGDEDDAASQGGQGAGISGEDGTDAASAQEGEGTMQAIRVEANGQVMNATLEDNSSAQAFAALLAEGPLTVSMHDYAGMEKVGALPQGLPRNDSQISVGPGDIILYQGNQITVYYGTNSWSFTKLGHVEGMSGTELLAALGDGNVEVTFSLA